MAEGGDAEGVPKWLDGNYKELEEIPYCVPKKCGDISELVGEGGDINCDKEFNYKSRCDLDCKQGFKKVTTEGTESHK